MSAEERIIRELEWDLNTLKVERDAAIAAALMDARLELRRRLMNFGGFQHAQTGQFWVGRDDVLSLIDEVVTASERKDA